MRRSVIPRMVSGFYITIIIINLLVTLTTALLFRVDQFTDVTKRCKTDKKLSYILNEDKPAMYISIDPNKPKGKMKVKKHRDIVRHDQLYKKYTANADKSESVLNAIKKLKELDKKVDKKLLKTARIAFERYLKAQNRNTKKIVSVYANKTFDCSIQFETELPKGDKTSGKYDALSLIIVELSHNSILPVDYPNLGGFGDSAIDKNGKLGSKNPFPKIFSFLPVPNSRVEVVTSGKNGRTYKNVTKRAQYSERIWPGNNPNFLLSGQLSGFDSIDYRTKIDPQHIVKPENLYSHFDTPARVTINVKDWSPDSHIYMVVTSYKYLRQGQSCQKDKEFDCTTTQSFLSSNTDHMCMSISLACDGIPNCGQDYLPNMDENCFKIHWSSVLLSLVSYILLAITLLLCLSCFARVLIQWSVRSSLAELHRGVTSPSGSFRSPSRFFSFLGTTLSTRWERPPPTYDEAMKHINPDLVNQPPPNPPAYSDTINGRNSIVSFSTGRRRLGRGYLRRHRSSSSSIGASGGNGMIQTPPPEYQSQESGLHRLHLELDLEGVHNPLNPLNPRIQESIENELQESSNTNPSDNNGATNRRRNRFDDRQANRRSNPLATSRSISRIRYARYDRSNCVVETSRSSDIPTVELSTAQTNSLTEDSGRYAGLISKIPQNPNVIILPPSTSLNRSIGPLLSNASISSLAISIPESEMDNDNHENTSENKKDISGDLSQSLAKNGSSKVDSSDNPEFGNVSLSLRNPNDKVKDNTDDDEDILDDDILEPSFSSPLPYPGSSMLSLSALSNSSEILFSDNFRRNSSSPGSAHSHHSYDSNLSSSSEASVKTVVRVSSTTVQAEICVNKTK